MANETKVGSPGILAMNFSADLTSLGAISAGAVGTLTVTVPTLEIGMLPRITMRAAIDIGLCMVQPPWVSAADTLKIAFLNPTASPITPAAAITCDLFVP
jgi:hypothetical protein